MPSPEPPLPGPPVVVVLAAGASRRLGEPKALVDLGGQAALARLLDAAGRTAPTLVVTGAHHAAIEAWLGADPGRRAGTRLVHNPDWPRGRTGGLARAAAAYPDRDLLVAPCDVPLVPPEVFEALRAAWRRSGAPALGWLAPATETRAGETPAAEVPGICVPVGSLRPGHPILIGRGLAARLAGLEPGTPLRRLREAARPLWTVQVESEAIHDDLDTPEDLARLRARFLP